AVVARHAALTSLRHRHDHLLIESVEIIAEDDTPPEEGKDAEAAIEFLRAAIRRMEGMPGEAARCCWLEGGKRRRVAKRLGVGDGTLTRLLGEAREVLYYALVRGGFDPAQLLQKIL